MTTGTRVIRKSTGQSGTVSSAAFLISGTGSTKHYAVLVDFSSSALLTAVPVEELVTVSDKAAQDKALSEHNEAGKRDTARLNKLEALRIAMIAGRDVSNPHSLLHITLMLQACKTIRQFLDQNDLNTATIADEEGAGDGR